MYDLSTANEFLYPIGFGLHHSGVEILGSEYSFAGGGGIFESSPKEAAGAKFRESIEVGTFDGGSVELRKVISDLRTDFGPDSYNLIRKNCNHFANALVWALLGKPIPGYVNRLADIGTCMACLLPKKMLEAAPVGPPGSGGSSTGNGGYQVFGGGSRSSSTRETTGSFSTFSGSGSKLGSSSNNSERDNQGLLGSISSFGGTANIGKSDLTDRREKARKAALARFEKQQTDDHVP